MDPHTPAGWASRHPRVTRLGQEAPEEPTVRPPWGKRGFPIPPPLLSEGAEAPRLVEKGTQPASKLTPRARHAGLQAPDCPCTIVKVKVAQSCQTHWDPMDFSRPWNSPGQSTGVGSLSLLQGDLPNAGIENRSPSNTGLPHCRRFLYQLSHKGSPRILEWVALSLLQQIFPTQESNLVSCIAGGFFTNWALREAAPW